MTSHNILFSGIQIDGKDAHHFLNGFCTSNISKLKTNQGVKTLFCNSKGRIIASGFVFCLNPKLLFIATEHETLDSLCEHLNRYRLLSDVALRASNEYSLDITSKTPTASIPLGGDYSAILITSPKEAQTLPIDTTEIVELLMNLHYPLMSKNISQTFTPHQLRLEKNGWIDFQKGCYLGQEIITRMHHLGKTKQTLQRYTVSAKKKTPLLPGQTCLNRDQKSVGQVLYGSPQQVLACVNISELENELIINDDITLKPIVQ